MAAGRAGTLPALLVKKLDASSGVSKGEVLLLLGETAERLGERPKAPPNFERALGVRRADGTTLQVPARVWRLKPSSSKGAEASEASEQAEPAEQHAWPVRPAVAAMADSGAAATETPRPKYGVAPSRAAEEWKELAAWMPGEVISIGPRLPFAGDETISWNVVGDTLHAFLAADTEGLPREERLARAQRLLAASGVLALFKPESLLDAGDSLRKALDARYPGATWRREVPVTAWLPTPDGERRIEGAIDLLLETPEGVVLIDHKTFPGGGEARLREKAAGYGAQFAAYARALEAAGEKVLGGWVHFAVSGAGVGMGIGMGGGAG